MPKPKARPPEEELAKRFRARIGSDPETLATWRAWAAAGAELDAVWGWLTLYIDGRATALLKDKAERIKRWQRAARRTVAGIEAMPLELRMVEAEQLAAKLRNLLVLAPRARRVRRFGAAAGKNYLALAALAQYGAGRLGRQPGREEIERLLRAAATAHYPNAKDDFEADFRGLNRFIANPSNATLLRSLATIPPETLAGHKLHEK